MPRRAAAQLAALLATAVLTATALGATSGGRKPGHYAGATSEQWSVTFTVTDHGRRIRDFATRDGYNNMCHFTGGTPHIFHFIVKVPLMKVRRNGSFAAKATATEGPFKGTFRVKGKLSTAKATGMVTRLKATCGSGASNPKTSAYYETYKAERR